LIWYVDMLTWFAKSSKKHPKYIQLFHFRIGSSGTAGQRWPKWPTVGSQLPAGHPTWNDHSTTSKRSVWTASVVEMDIGVQLSNVTCYLTWSDLVDDLVKEKKGTRSCNKKMEINGDVWQCALGHQLAPSARWICLFRACDHSGSSYFSSFDEAESPGVLPATLRWRRDDAKQRF
jgi:hypothetical protein